jgi:hypothetical protein
MLSDRERATWEQIQDQFLTDDPGFVQRFNAPPSDLPPNTRRRPTAQVHRLLLWCGGVLSVLLLFAGAVGGALLIAMLFVAMLIERR